MAEGEAVQVSQTSSAEEDHLEHSVVDGRYLIQPNIDLIVVAPVYLSSVVLFLLLTAILGCCASSNVASGALL